MEGPKKNKVLDKRFKLSAMFLVHQKWCLFLCACLQALCYHQFVLQDQEFAGYVLHGSTSSGSLNTQQPTVEECKHQKHQTPPNFHGDIDNHVFRFLFNKTQTFLTPFLYIQILNCGGKIQPAKKLLLLQQLDF